MAASGHFRPSWCLVAYVRSTFDSRKSQCDLDGLWRLWVAEKNHNLRPDAAAIRAMASGSQQSTMSAINHLMAFSLSVPMPTISAT
jgi:hypothetical protein